MIWIMLTILIACGDSENAKDTSGIESNDQSSQGEDNIHTVDTPGMYFEPKDLVISIGDTVRFRMTSTHNAVEVSQETYDNIGTTALEGGFVVDYGQTMDVVFDDAGVHYYVCQPHVMLDMVGTITVE